MVATGTTAADVVGSFMALLSFADSAPRAYRRKVGNACPPISTSTGTSPCLINLGLTAVIGWLAEGAAHRLVDAAGLTATANVTWIANVSAQAFTIARGGHLFVY
jgi:hypothetical protein